MKPYLQALAGALLLVLGLATYVTLKVSGDLRAVRSILTTDVQDIEPAEVKLAEDRLAGAQRTLGSASARMLRVIPVLGHNMNAVSDIVDAALPVLSAGSDLTSRLDPLRDGGLIDEGKIDIEKIGSLSGSVDRQASALRELAETANDVRSGWLIPPLWEAVDELRTRVSPLAEGAAALEGFVEVSDRMLGGGEPRTYLALLLNNAELRGAGGILAGVGTIELDDGEINIGKFRSVHALQTKPYESVPSPDDFQRRYGSYKADTTLWLNTSFSPDVPDVALVASKLYEKTAGVATDGAIVLDPRGIAALLPEDAEVRIPGGEDSLDADEVAPFIYSDAYALYKNQVARRNAILALGKSAIKKALDADLGGTEGLDRVGGALAGGHIRFVSFDEEEAKVLDRTGVTGELDAGEDAFPLRVVSQNFGSDNGQGTKLDYWVDRDVVARCSLELEDDPEMQCAISTVLTNEVPGGLGEYVGGAPYGVLETLVETYVPREADIASVEVDGRVEEAFVEPHGPNTSVGIFTTVPAGEERTIDVSFSAPISSEGATLSFTPQTLTKDADLDLRVEVPRGWRIPGGDEHQGSFDGPLDSEVTVGVEPDPHAGFGAVWESVKRFWRDPLF